jgi:lipid II:glycine glycyltransferase (peptidoglycan interpeptide bridge formation enzyme)
MEIKEIENKKIWEDFLLGCEEKTFLQSFNWGDFQKMMGNKIWRFGIFKESEQLACALVIKIEAKRGTFLFLPHGPVIKSQTPNTKSQILESLVKDLKKLAKDEGASFIRIAPILGKNDENIKIFKNLGFRDAPIHIHPELTWELDLSPSENELLMGMRKTTRYLIRQALKNKDIKIEEENNFDGIEKFNDLYQITKERHGFVPFPLDYLKNEFLAFSKENQVSVLLGKYKEEVVAGGIFIFWQKIGFYHHGASSQKYPKIPVSYLLLWDAIKKAKNLGCQKFNFWGIAPISEFSVQSPSFKNHPWAGLTLFKIGFGGYKKEYVKTQDLPLSKGYWLCFLIEKLRSKRRGF